MNLIFSTSAAHPNLSASDLVLAKVLEARGHKVKPAIWTQDQQLFAQADAIIFRAHWDYHEKADLFTTWLNWLETLGLPVFNSPSLVRWNLNKIYLLELTRLGVSTPKMALLEPAQTLEACLETLGLEEAVVKPVYGASGYYVERVYKSNCHHWESTLRSKRVDQNWLVQAFLAHIEEGEWSLIFVEGQFSHAIRKMPARGEFRINTQYGGRYERVEPAADLVESAQKVLKLLADKPLYARIDGVWIEGVFTLLELELNEPGLYYDLAPEKAPMFAESLERFLSPRV